MVIVLLGFVIVLFCLGYPLVSRLKQSWDECFVMSVGVGLAVLPLVLWVARWLLPLKWWVVVLFAVCGLVLSLYFRRPEPKQRSTTYAHLVMLVVLFVIHFAVFLYGAFVYTYLEDSDPLYHAVGAWKVAREGVTFWERYLEPYPPFYDILVGLLVQLTGDVVDTLKVANALIVSLGVLFAFYAAREFAGQDSAVWSVLVLALIPSYVSHFIFAASWATTLFWPALYLFGKVQKDHGVWWLLGVVASGVFLVQPIAGAVFAGVFVLYLMMHSPRAALAKAFVFSVLLALSYWGFVFAAYGVDKVFSHVGIGMLTGDDTSGGVVYGVWDFLFASTDTRIDAPTGWGVMVSVLLGLSFVFRHPSWRWLWAWLALGIVGLEGNVFPVHLAPHRLWTYVAMPVALLSGHAAAVCARRSRWIGLLIVVGLVLSAGVPKFVVNTNVWQRGPEWASYNEVFGYASLQKLGPGLRVMAPCAPEWKVVANNQVWIDAPISAWNASVVLAQAKNLSVDVAIFDESCILHGLINQSVLEQVVSELTQDTVIVSRNPGFVALSIP
ncbi:glycosyltransferase family 39 protein [Candidatus Woesearchaeota archaeon]|nr:glycosyltransferase family 39 protein [Candidatus Woesearchaeota archaeon]